MSDHHIEIKKNQIERSIFNKINIAFIAIRIGVDIIKICNEINWRDFEVFASEIMKYHGYAIYNNFRLKKPTREIDIVGIKSKNALLVDCKHWKRNSISSLNAIVEKQKDRSALFIQKSKFHVKNAFPIILTFLPCDFTFVNNVPIVSVNALNSFLLDFDNNCQDFHKV